jgi:ABC-type iron transport system FetAB ATPase subunit
MTREKRTLQEFLLEYATTFIRQYLAYCEQDADLFSQDIELSELLAYQTTHKAGIMAQISIERFLKRYNSKYTIGFLTLFFNDL